MRVELITIGSELLLGFTIDGNAAHLARVLADQGIRIVRRATVGDDPDVIADAVREALDRTGGVITTGGLGPTSDDMSKTAIAALFGRAMRLDEDVLAALESRWRDRGLPLPLPASNRRQAELPEGSRVLVNRHGSAPGVWLDDERGRWVAMLPGVPREMRGMLGDELLPLLLERRAAAGEAHAVLRSRTLRTWGIAESALADRLGGLAREVDGIAVAYLPSATGVDLRLTAESTDPSLLDARLGAALRSLGELVGDHAYGEDEADMAALVLNMCRERDLFLAFAESCTGGLLGARLTSVPGSSDVVLGGVVAYADSVKRRMLGIGADTIAAHGAVSEQVARAMAEGVRDRFGASAALSITGVAGPGGGSAGKPVGTVWMGIDLEGDVQARKAWYPGDREEVRQRATQGALDLLRRALERRARGQGRWVP